MISLHNYVDQQLIFEGKAISYDVANNMLQIDCKYCTLKAPIANVSFIIKDNEILKSNDLLDNVDMEHIENSDVGALMNVIKEKADVISKELEKFETEDVTDCILRFSDCQLWPPATESIEKLDLEFYIDFSIDFKFQGPIAALISGDIEKLGTGHPDIDVGKLHVLGLGKVNLKPLIKLLLSYSTTYWKIFYYVFKNLVNTDEKSFKQIAKDLERDIKKSIDDDMDELKKLPNSVEIDDNPDVEKFIGVTNNVLSKK